MSDGDDGFCVTCHQPSTLCEGHRLQHEAEGVPDEAEQRALFEANRARLAALSARGFTFNMQSELMEELVCALFGAVGTAPRVVWQLQWERKVAARLDTAEQTAAQIEAQRMQQAMQQRLQLPGQGR